MSKAFPIIGVILGTILVIVSFTVEVPSRSISMYGGYHEYVGGDAYNIQIEASIRGGEISGAQVSKAVYMTGGLMLLGGSLIALGFSLTGKKAQAVLSATSLGDGLGATAPIESEPIPLNNEEAQL